MRQTSLTSLAEPGYSLAGLVRLIDQGAEPHEDLRQSQAMRKLDCSMSCKREAPNTTASIWQEKRMFKAIGVAVVYGFALFGLARYLDEIHSVDTRS